MRKLLSGIILLVFFLFLPHAEAASGINRMLGFRGILRTSAGAAVSDGTYSFILLIYDSETGGSCVYSARGTCGAPTAKSLSVSSGSFATVLGESSDNSITLDFNSDSYFLEVRVGGETMSPRSRLAAAPYAFTAGDLEGLTTSSFIRSNTTSTGRGHVILNANAVGSGVSSGTLFINPGSAAAGTTILGIATATSTVNLILDAEGDLSIRGNFTPTSNTVSDLGAYGAAWRDVYASGTVYGHAAVTSSLVQSQALQVFSASSTIFHGEIEGSNRLRTSAIVRYQPSQTPTFSMDSAMNVLNYSTVSNGSQFYRPTGLVVHSAYGGTAGSASVNVDGAFVEAYTISSMTGGINILRGGNFLAQLYGLAANVSSTIGLQGGISLSGNAAGSVVGTSTATEGLGGISQNITILNRAMAINGRMANTAGTIPISIGVMGDSNTYATSSFAGYFSRSPVWIDADYLPDTSNHGASNTPGALHVGSIAEINSDLYVDGPLHASSTVMFTGAATTTNIYPWTNNTYDLGAYGAAWRDIFASGTVSSSIFDSLRFQSSATGTYFATPTDVPGNAAFVFDTTNDLTGGTTANATSTALMLLRDAGIDRLSIIATSSDSVVFRSHVVSSTANKVAAFVFETSNYVGSSTNAIGGANVLFSIRNQSPPGDPGNIDPEFAVYAGGTVVADGSFVANGTPGDVAEYVEIEGEAVEPGDVLVTSEVQSSAYQKSSAAYSSYVAGVVATTPKFVIGQPNGTNAPLVLTGLADVKIIDENGPIARGDLLVSSSKPGYAMRYDPFADDGEALVGIIGTALEPLESGEGKIQAMIRSSWVNNRNATIAKLANDMMMVATAAGVDLSPYQSDRRPTRLESELKKSATDEWFLDDAGNFRTTGTYASVINTSKGEVPFYAVQSPKVELVFSGSGRTNRGAAFVVFDDIQAESIDPETPIKVVATQTEAGPGVYVTDKSNSGFTVRVVNDGFEEVNFDWIVIGRRKGYGEPGVVVEEIVQDVAEDLSPPPEIETPTSTEPTSKPASLPLPLPIEEVPTSTPEEPVL